MPHNTPTCIEPMPYEEFKSRIIGHVGDRVRFQERGQNGWTSIGLSGTGDSITLIPGNPGPHWCDVSFIHGNQWLVGHYDFNAKMATFYNKWRRYDDKRKW